MVKTVLISDTHGAYEHLEIPESDLLVHAGDITRYGGSKELVPFRKWLNKQPVKHVIITPGNHDIGFERDPAKARRRLTLYAPDEKVENAPQIHILIDSGVEIEGKKFWGSPYTRGLFKMNWWAFGAPDETMLKFHWDKIPTGLDLLITHSPARNILDKTIFDDIHAGSISLTAAIFDRVKPRRHVCGHIHESYGIEERYTEGITFYNASIMNEKYEPVNKPIVIAI
jgi:Icc-related predicted phosphoesterase